jgi:hypothetical protein
MTLADELRQNVRIGNDAGWLLTFHRETPGTGGPTVVDRPELAIGSDRYYAEIHAGLPAGLEGGTYTFVVEGLPDDLHASIAQRGPDAPSVVRLYLFWHEVLAGVTGALRNLAGLTGSASDVSPEDVPGGPVAVLRVVGVSRKAGARRYETTVTARERVFEALSAPLCGAGIEAATASAAIDALAPRSPVALRFRGDTPSPDAPPAPAQNAGDTAVRFEAGRPVVELLSQLAARLEQRTNRYGRGMLLVRDGVLHVGTRPVPLESGPVPALTPQTGLVETEALPVLETDPSFDRCSGGRPATRRQFRLTLKGRPDLKPGDVVEFSPPAEDAGTAPRPVGLIGDLRNAPLLPSLGGHEAMTRLYVTAVDHALSRVAAFTTMLTGVELEEGRDAWDAHTERPETPPDEPAHADPAVEAAHAVRRLARVVAGARRPADVAEVRQVTSSGTGEPPAQTELVWRGLVAGDGRAHGARRLAVERAAPSPLGGVPYLSPFAWGACGLVLPRYPGTRVLLVHRNGSDDDALDAGAVWESGHAPDSHPGDWWLILPAEVPTADRAAIAEGSTPADYTGKATNDLIDADGNRCIEVGKLTVRVGVGGLGQAGTRPAAPAADVAIEHSDGKTMLLVKDDGTIEIRAATKLTLTVDDGDIEMNASSVNVHVSGSMNVTD